jgi:membrane protease YdiL (CAAX protease family)
MRVTKILISILTIIIVAVLPHLGLIPIPFAYSIPILIIIWIYLKYNNENFVSIGFSWKLLNLKSIIIGCLFAVLIFLFIQFIFFPIVENFIDFDDVEVELYDKITESKEFFIFILLMGWIIGGLYEEIVFHGFIFHQLEKIINGKYAVIISFLVTGLIFGLYHIQLGTAGALNAFLAGIGYHSLFLIFKRNLWYSIFCHAFFDTIAITLLYIGYF